MSQSFPTLGEAVRAVLPHASKDGTTPILMSVRVHPDRVIATDRYTLAVARHNYSGPSFEPFTLSATDAKIVSKHATPDAITWGGTAYRRTLTFVYQDSASFTFAEVEGEYPDVERLFPNDLDAAPGVDVPFGVSVANLAKFAPLSKTVAGRHSSYAKTTALVWRFQGARKPATVTFDDWFTARVAPIRLPD